MKSKQPGNEHLVAYIFDKLIADSVRAGHVPARTAVARTWMAGKARKTRTTSESLMSGNRSKMTNIMLPGQMIMFGYDAKHKKTLKYFDAFPCVFPFKKLNDGFLGINLHYLNLQMRAKLMDGLYSFASDTRYDERTKLNLSYNLLNAAAKVRFFKPTIHRYLDKQIRSRFLAIDSVEWQIAAFLPVERFKGASNQKVWSSSKKAMK